MHQGQTLVGHSGDDRLQHLLCYGSRSERPLEIPWFRHTGIGAVKGLPGQRIRSMLPMSTAHASLKDLGIQAVNPGGSTGSNWWSGHTGGPLLHSTNPATG